LSFASGDIMQKRFLLLVLILLSPNEILNINSTRIDDQIEIQYTEGNISGTNGDYTGEFVLDNLQLAKNNSKLQILEEANSWVSHPIVIPLFGGNWTQYFTCDDGNRLEYDPNESSQFWCESEAKWYVGEQYETAWVSFKHREIISTAGLNLAMAYMITNNSTYADSVKDILLQYATLYPNLEANNRFNTTVGNTAKLTTQSLDEAVLIIDLAWSYQMIKITCSLEEQQNIEQNLLLAGVEVLLLESNLKHPPISNWFSYHNSAIMMVGSTLGNQSLIDEALDGPRGFKFQLANGVYEDGLWHEGSISYHNYTLNSMLYILESGRRIGLDLYNLTVYDPISNTNRTVKDMFLAPLGMVRPDGFIPRLNDDIRGTNLHDMLRTYELANLIWEDEVFDWALIKALEIGDRKGWATYFWGHEISPTNKQPQSKYYDGSGIGVLRTENSFLLLDYGPHGGGHGHYDKLSFELFSHGKERFIDSGVTVYSLPMSSEWFRTTLGHSTLMVGNQNQLQASGTLLNFYSFERGGLISASVNNISSGVNSVRSFLLLDLDVDGVILIDLMNASSNHLQNYSSIYHGINQMNIISNQSITNVEISEDAPWSYLNTAREISIQNDSQFRWNLEQNHSVDLFIPEQPMLETAFLAQAPNNPTNESHDLIVINATKELFDVEFISMIHSRTTGSAQIKNYSLTRVNQSFFAEIQFGNNRNISLEMFIPSNIVEVIDVKPSVEQLIGINETDSVPNHVQNSNINLEESEGQVNPVANDSKTSTINSNLSSLFIVVILIVWLFIRQKKP